MPVAGDGVLCKLRVLLGGHAELVVRPGLDVLRLGLMDGPGRVLPDALFCVPHPLPESGLAQKLGAVGPLGSHVFMLHLINLAIWSAETLTSPGAPAGASWAGGSPPVCSGAFSGAGGSGVGASWAGAPAGPASNKLGWGFSSGLTFNFSSAIRYLLF